MIYDYNSRVVNMHNDFLDEKNFVGYILPNGSIYECKNHNISNISTFLKMYLKLLDMDYNNRKEIFDVDTNDELGKVIIKRLKSLSHDEVHALLEFAESVIILSDILVGFFGCHMITRLNKTIITSKYNHRCFYNYLLHDFHIDIIPRIIYDVESKKYRYVNSKNRNDYLYDEIKSLKSEVRNSEIELFTK